MWMCVLRRRSDNVGGMRRFRVREDPLQSLRLQDAYGSEAPPVNSAELPEHGGPLRARLPETLVGALHR